MTATYVIVSWIAAALFFVSMLVVALLGFKAQSFTRKIRYFLLIAIAFLFGVMYVALANKQSRVTRADGAVVWWTRYAFHIPQFLAMGIYLAMTLTPNVPTTLFGGVLTGLGATFLLFGALSIENMIWIWFLFAGACFIAFEAFMILWVPPITKLVYNRGGTVDRELADNTVPPLKRWVVRLISLGFMIYLMFYGLDTTWGDVKGFTPVWDSISQAIWDGLFFALLVVTFAWPIDAEEEYGESILSQATHALVSSDIESSRATTALLSTPPASVPTPQFSSSTAGGVFL